MIYRKMLTGKLEYEAPNSNLDSFTGFFKLKKDPKIEQLSIDNLILRGSRITRAGW